MLDFSYKIKNNIFRNMFLNTKQSETIFLNPLILSKAIIITDGQSTNEIITWQEAIRLRNSGVHVTAVGVGSGVNKHELLGMASFPAENNVFLVNNFDGLVAATTRRKLIDTICNSESYFDKNFHLSNFIVKLSMLSVIIV